MKRLTSLMIVCFLTIALVACGETNHEGEAKIPSDSSEQKGRAYQEVVKDFQDQGFTNIKTVVLDDLITGWLVTDGEVESVTVDGDEEYYSDDWYPKDVAVVVTYHTFPEQETSDAQSAQESTEQNSVDAEDEILTLENNQELAALFADGENEELCKAFIDKYQGRTIEFDGNIANIAPHGNFETRYDFLIYAGDYSEVSSNGSPAMQFEDKNFSDLKLTGDNAPGAVKVGDNLHIIAKVDDLINNFLIILKPISTELR